MSSRLVVLVEMMFTQPLLGRMNESPEYVKKEQNIWRWCSFSRQRRQCEERLIYCAHFNVCCFFDKKIRKESMWGRSGGRSFSLPSPAPESVTRVATHGGPLAASSPPTPPSVVPATPLSATPPRFEGHQLVDGGTPASSATR